MTVSDRELAQWVRRAIFPVPDLLGTIETWHIRAIFQIWSFGQRLNMSLSSSDRGECKMLNFGTPLTFASCCPGLACSSQISDVSEKQLKVMTSFVRRYQHRSRTTLMPSSDGGSISLMAGRISCSLRLKRNLVQRRTQT